MTTEKNIVHESGSAWVLLDRSQGRYTVFIAGTTHSTSDSAYALTSDGLSLAIARADYIAKREQRRIAAAGSAA